MKKIYAIFSKRPRSISKLFYSAIILGCACVYQASAQNVPANFTAINWGTAASQQYLVNEAQGKVVNGKLYTFGGFDSRKPGLLPTKRSYVYNPQTDTWSSIADLPHIPNGSNFGGVTHAGIATDSTDIYLAAGVVADSAGTGSIEGTKQVWKYIISQNTYIRLPDLPVDIAGGQLEYLNGQLHYFGGFIEDREIDVATHYVLDLNNLNNGWTTLAPLPNPRQHAGSTVFGGKIYSIGGQIGEIDTLKTQKDVNVYDPATDTWTRLADLPVPSGATGRGHISSAVVVLGQRIIVLGGELVYKKGQTNMVSAYSPASNTWQNLNPLPVTRYSGVAAVLDGNIYYTGGSYTNATYKGIPALPGLFFTSANVPFYVTQDGTAANKTISLTSNQGTPSITLSKSANSDWLILPSPKVGSLSFGINATGLVPGTYVSSVKASSKGYTDANLSVTLVVYPAGTLVPIADAYVRDGSYAAINYGGDTILDVKGTSSIGYTRTSYLKFSLGNISNIATAKLRIYGYNTDNTSGINISPYGVDTDSWTENAITFNNAPAASTAALSSTAVNSQAKYYEFDVTSYIAAQASGDKIATLLIKNSSKQNTHLAFNSKENNQNPPQLIITTVQNDTTPPAVNIQINGTSYAANTYNNQAEVVISASDQGGSGLASTEYSLNGAAFQTYSSSIIINTTGSYTIKARAADGKGNVTVTNDTVFNVIYVPATLSDTLTPVADAFTRDGSYAAINYGSDTALVVKGSATSGYSRWSYLKFSLSNVTNVSSARLRIYGSNKDNATTTNISCYGADSDTWTESGITWKTAPAASTAALSSAGVNDQAKYYEFDVTNYVKAQFSGDKVVSLLIKDPANKVINLTFNSKENIQNRPQLVITSANTLSRPANNQVSFSFTEKMRKPTIYPNPVEKRFSIKFPDFYQGNFDLQIIDQFGRIYNAGTTKLSPGASNISVDISKFSLPAGVYFLRIHSKSINEQIKFIVR